VAVSVLQLDEVSLYAAGLALIEQNLHMLDSMNLFENQARQQLSDLHCLVFCRETGSWCVYCKRLKGCIALYRKPIAKLRSVTCHMGSHRWTCPTLTPAKQAGSRFTYRGGMKGWVDLGGCNCFVLSTLTTFVSQLQVQFVSVMIFVRYSCLIFLSV